MTVETGVSTELATGLGEEEHGTLTKALKSNILAFNCLQMVGTCAVMAIEIASTWVTDTMTGVGCTGNLGRGLRLPSNRQSLRPRLCHDPKPNVDRGLKPQPVLDSRSG